MPTYVSMSCIQGFPLPRIALAKIVIIFHFQNFLKKFYELLKFHLKIVPSLTVNIGLFGVEKFHSPISVFFLLKNLYMLRVVIPFTSIPVIVISYYSVYCHSFTFFFGMPYKRLRNREAHYPNSLAIVAGYRWLRCILSISAFHLVRRGCGLFQSY